MSDVNTLAGSSADMNEFKKLQQRLNHESIRHQFRTKLVGGLNEEDVTKYIEDLEEKFRKLEQENKKTSDEIYSLKTKLNMELQDNEILQTNLDDVKHNLNTYIVEFKQKEIANKSLNEKYNAESIIMKNEIQQIKECAAKFENDNNVLINSISELKKDNTQIELLKNENNYVSEKLKSLEELLNQSSIEYEQLKENAIKFESDNNLMINRISELTKENMQIDLLKNENNHISEELKSLEELLNQSSAQYEQLKINADKFKNKNILMNEKIAELENNISAKDYKISELNSFCVELKQQLETEKSCSEKLNSDLVIFKQKNNSLQDTITEKLSELEEQRKISDKAVLELSIEKAAVLSYKINGFKDEFSEIYKKMENLEHEANQNFKSSSIIQQQLAMQQNRAEKAENDLATFIKLLSGVEDKFYSQRNSLGDEFTQLVEKQIIKKPEMNDSLMSLD